MQGPRQQALVNLFISLKGHNQYDSTAQFLHRGLLLNFQTEKHPTITPNVQPYFFIMRTSRENPREFSVVQNFQPNLDGSIDLTMGFLRKPKN